MTECEKRAAKDLADSFEEAMNVEASGEGGCLVSFEGEILAGAAALLAAYVSFKGIKVRIEHSEKRDENA